jgi:hypothetical protein
MTAKLVQYSCLSIMIYKIIIWCILLCIMCEYHSHMWTYTLKSMHTNTHTHTHNTEAVEQSRRGEDEGKGNMHVLNTDVTLNQ